MSFPFWLSIFGLLELQGYRLTCFSCGSGLKWHAVQALRACLSRKMTKAQLDFVEHLELCIGQADVGSINGLSPTPFVG